MSFVPLTAIRDNTQGMPDPHVSRELRTTTMGTLLKHKEMKNGWRTPLCTSQLPVMGTKLSVRDKGRKRSEEGKQTLWWIKASIFPRGLLSNCAFWLIWKINHNQYKELAPWKSFLLLSFQTHLFMKWNIVFSCTKNYARYFKPSVLFNYSKNWRWKSHISDDPISLQELFSFVPPCAFQTKTTSRVWHCNLTDILHTKSIPQKNLQKQAHTHPQGIAARLCACSTSIYAWCEKGWYIKMLYTILRAYTAQAIARSISRC